MAAFGFDEFYPAEKREETSIIIISQISLLLTQLNETNFELIEEAIGKYLYLSSDSITIKYWKKLILLCSSDIKTNHTLSPDKNLFHRLLCHLFEELAFKNLAFIKTLQLYIFKDESFKDQSSLDITDYEFLANNLGYKSLIEALYPEKKPQQLEKNLTTLKMNHSVFLSKLIKQTNVTSFEPQLSDTLATLSGESLNDMVALLLSEILSPGSQNLQDDVNHSWFTPLSIPDAIKVGEQISNSLKSVSQNINWNRVFNLISTKYFMSIPINATLVSLNSILSALKQGNLIDQFFNCDWNVTFKLLLSCLLHKWNVDKGCIDLLSIPKMKKVSDTIPNEKNSLLYLMSIANLDMELFLLRDELKNKPMLSTFQEFFYQDFSLVPEYLYLALATNMKHFTLLIEKKSIIDDILTTLIIHIFEDSSNIFNELLSILPAKDKFLMSLGEQVMKRGEDSTSKYIKVMLQQNKLETFMSYIEFEEAFKLSPQAITLGWTGFKPFMKKNLVIKNFPIILDNLELQIKTESTPEESQVKTKFPLDTLKFLVNALDNMPFSDEQLERYENLQYNIIIAFPRIINYGNGHDQAISANGEFNPINPDVEKEMQGYLQKMYTGELSIKDVVDVLRKLKDSDTPRDQDVFACITHAILAECVFFKDYPLEALATTSVLFGSMVLFNIFSGFVLDVALRKVLVFAKEGPESKMFKFAIQAIYAFRMRLADFPQYCKDLLNDVPNLTTQTQVYQFIYEAAQITEGSVSNGNEKANAPVELIPQKYFFVGEWNAPVPQENPPKEVTEKVLFIVNNLTMDNFKTKIPDLKEVLKATYFAWFANYLVNQRAKTEPNYHELYVRIVVALDSQSFYNCILNITLRQLYMFIGTKDIQTVDKKILKNLALWLGTISLGCDKPIRHQNVAFRELLLEAYRENRLEIIVPFVTKVLENATGSKVFRPPNPWTVGILKLLLELNQKANWKLSLTFEVEVLFKAFKLSMNDLEPTNYIEVQDIVDTLAGNMNAMSIEQQQMEHQKQGILMQQYQQQMMMHQQRQQQMMPMVNEQQQQHPQQNSFAAENSTFSNETPFNNLTGSTIFVTHPELKRVFQIALAKSVREILIPAVEKSSNIAVVTTSKIVIKDFSTEVDEMKLKVAAITMVRQLAQSLARATSIEPLREAIRSTTQSLAPNLVALPGSPIEELDVAINDNLDLALNLIEDAAMERASQEISEPLMQAVAIRRYHLERRADQPFLDPNGNMYSLSLPEPLGLKNTGITPQQFRIYEEFGNVIPGSNNMNLPGQDQNMINQNTALSKQKLQQIMLQKGQQVPQPNMNQLPQQPQQPQQQQLQQKIVPQQQIPSPQTQSVVQTELEQNHRVLVHLMDVLVAQIKENADKTKLSELGEQNQIKNIIFQILTFIARSMQKDQLALKVAQAVVNSLFATSESSLCREVLSLLLEKLCSLSMVARKDVVWWLIYALDTRKFDVPVIRSLLEVKLIDAAELDTILVTTMEQKMEKSIDFAIDLLKDVVLSDKPLLMRMDFVKTLEFLGSIKNDKAKKFLKEIEKEKVLPVEEDTNVSPTEKYFLVFTEWVKLLQRVSGDDKIVNVFIRQLLEKGVLSDSDSLIKFIKSALELSVYSFKESDPTSDVFTAVDALSKLIVKLMIVQEFSEYSRKEYLNMICSVILLVFSKDHEEESGNFNERPYFRLLSNLFFEWSIIRGHNFASISDKKTRKELRKFDGEFYNIFGSFLHSMQPFAFSGFSFAWVSLISHRMFLPIILSLPDKAGWEAFMLLIIDLFKFLDKYTKKDSISDAISVVYKGTLRIILGISNDFPEFLIENHYELMNNIPNSYIQLRNVILSAIPKKTMAPNPYDADLDLDKIELCEKRPEVFHDPINDILAIKKPMDNYLRIPSNSLLKNIINATFRTEYDVRNGIGYDYLSIDNKVVRAIVLHVGIEAGLETSSSAIFNLESAYYALLFNMINDGSSELRFQVLQVMVEQLRYPNIHTHWFIYVLLNMFTSKAFGDNLPEVQEIMLRCILERVMANKPHPWGVTVLFSKLIRQEGSNLLELPFIEAIPQVEKIFNMLLNHEKAAIEGQDAQKKEVAISTK